MPYRTLFEKPIPMGLSKLTTALLMGLALTACSGDNDSNSDAPPTEIPDNGGNTGSDTSGGDTSGGDTSGGDTSGGDTNGGDTSGGDTSGGDTSGGDTSGGDTSGGDTSGGDTSGGDTSGGDTTDTGPCGNKEGVTLISAVQGIGNEGSAIGTTVSVEGIVTGLTSSGFFIQEETADYDEDANTSEGIFVYTDGMFEFTNAAQITKGEVYRVEGSVSEFHDNTQITITDATSCGTSEPFPTAVVIPMPFEGVLELESIEGMYATVENALITDVYNLTRFGELTLGNEIRKTPSDTAIPLSDEYTAQETSNEQNILYIEDNSGDQNVDGLSFFDNFGYDNSIRIGDRITTSGPVNYSFGAYRINASDPTLTTLTSQTVPSSVDLTTGQIRIASFNVLNYFNGQVVGGGDLTELTSVVANGGFENWTGGVIDSWTTIDSGINITQVTDVVYAETSAASIEVTTGSQSSTDMRQSVEVTAGTNYRFSVRVQHTEGNMRARFFVDGYSNVYSDPTIIGQWQEYTFDYEATTTGPIDVGFRFYDQSGFDGNEVVYLDAFTAFDLDSATSYEISFADNGRGIDSQEGFELQEARIVQALADINADVVGLLELENDGFGEFSAIQSLVNALNAELTIRNETQLYSFVDPGVEQIGTDAITVGTIYKADVLALTYSDIIDIPDQVVSGQVEGQMRDSLVATFSFGGGSDSITVVTNHFKSKGSGCWEDENTPSAQDEAQGSCNAFRVSGSLAVADALDGAPDIASKIFLLGDLNAYSKEDPIAVLTDYDPLMYSYSILPAQGTPQYDTYVDATSGESLITAGKGYVLLAEDLDPGSYSYIFGGAVGSLDHILASPEAASSVVDMFHWNINSHEPSGFRANSLYSFYTSLYHLENYYGTDVRASSDHDPVVISVDLVQ
ncbi:hypothetical protein [Marinibactrum halimedae]|uniref:Endonuclease n=1 Tax=Marinibactrum halimedae TaxID=1444977 RepID=A0AA37WM05_9GAMM|nr:hypothetical protein [Marinibactrum halimedae]MCD9460306.1 hypothetical protein [Marinibactrum halimedae]GLS24396.1 hypothetical protein GCM10007877_01070 [Marinibactrum halimedae]